MTEEWLVSIGAISAFFVFSALVSGPEMALTASSRPRMHELARQGDRNAWVVLSLYARKERLLGGILLGNNLVNILAASIGTSVFLTLFGAAGVAYATAVMTVLVVIFGEVLPKTYALSHADRVALRVAPVIRVLVLVLAPITHAIHIVVSVILRPFGILLGPELSDIHREEELRGAIELHKGPRPDIRDRKSTRLNSSH